MELNLRCQISTIYTLNIIPSIVYVVIVYIYILIESVGERL